MFLQTTEATATYEQKKEQKQKTRNQIYLPH